MEAVSTLVNAGVGGLVILVVVLFLRHMGREAAEARAVRLAERQSFLETIQRTAADCAVCRRQFLEIITTHIGHNTNALNAVSEQLELLRQFLSGGKGKD